MKAKICDRCGKTYTHNNKVPTNSRIHGSYIGGIAYVTYDHDIDAVSDLCDSCVEMLFKDFLSYEKDAQCITS